MLISLILDIVLLVLLGVTIFYALRLNRKIEIFRSSQMQFEKTAQSLATATESAKQAIEAMRGTTEIEGRDLQKQIDEGHRLFDELKFMNEAGNSLASRLEKLSDGLAGKVMAKTTQPQAPSQQAEDLTKGKDDKQSASKADIMKKVNKPRSRAEEALQRAIEKKNKS